MLAIQAQHSVPDPVQCSAQQRERAYALLALAMSQSDQAMHFALQVGALHIARAIPDYWYTTASLAAQRSALSVSEAGALEKQLRSQVESAFAEAGHYALLDGLRRWDFHWEPLLDPRLCPPDLTLRRGAPMRLSTGPVPGSSAGLINFEPVFTGSGRRLGRANYYHVEQQSFVDEDTDECLPLGLIVQRFLEDVPAACERAKVIPDLASFLASQSWQFDTAVGRKSPRNAT
jgi:hypothetical protein